MYYITMWYDRFVSEPSVEALLGKERSEKAATRIG